MLGRVPAGAKKEVKSVGHDVGNGATLKAASHSFELRISNEVELRGDMVRLDITDQTDRRGVNRGVTEELPVLSAGLPFGYLLAILKTGVKNVDRTAKDVGAAQVVTTCASTAEKFNGHEPVSLGDVIVEPGGIR